MYCYDDVVNDDEYFLFVCLFVFWQHMSVGMFSDTFCFHPTTVLIHLPLFAATHSARL